MTNSAAEILLNFDRTARGSLGAQLRQQLRDAIRGGRLAAKTRLPSTRNLAGQLGVSRPVVVEAYAQLAAEGYLIVRPGARPVVAPTAAGRAIATRSASTPLESQPPRRFDLRPCSPDLAMFPRQAWMRSLRTALSGMDADALGYSDAQGSPRLRRMVADYLARVRGVMADPSQIFITTGFTEARALTCEVLSRLGLKRVAVEDPGYSDHSALDLAGLTRLPIPVDDEGLQTAQLREVRADAVFFTPAHQFPTGSILSPARRLQLRLWLEGGHRFALEDDYDAEFRYDHAPVGAMQGLVPERVLYAGTVSKTLAPALRLGWLVSPPDLVDHLRLEHRRWSEGAPRLEQEALADFFAAGTYERHLRRMRLVYRARRDRLLAALRDMSGVRVLGAAAGLHITLQLPDHVSETEIETALSARGVAVHAMKRYRVDPEGPPTLLIGYGRASEATLQASIQALREILGRVTYRSALSTNASGASDK